MNKVVIEVKENVATTVEAQNNEQMVGLWHHGQVAILGLELATLLKILLLM